jgi:pyruvate, orthophosphate dikinase
VVIREYKPLLFESLAQAAMARASALLHSLIRTCSGGLMAQPAADGKKKWLYAFAPGSAEGSAEMSALLGGKGANLAEMAKLGLPVPPGFTITTDVCAAYFAAGDVLPDALRPAIAKALDDIGATIGARFGDEDKPLLVSVRSGSRASMPGMMDTILNLGLNDRTVEALASLTGDARFAFDSYRRFIQMYGDVVLGVDHGVFEDILENYKNLNGFAADTDVDAEAWREIIADYMAAIVREHGAPFPQDTGEQLWRAVA